MSVTNQTMSGLTLLSKEQRARLAADATLGGGNILRKAVEANPHPDQIFIRSERAVTNTSGQPQSDFSLLQLDELAQSWSAWYLNQGVRPRDRVAVFLEDSFAYTIHFNALAQIGAVALCINSHASGWVAAGLCRQVGVVGIYTDQARLDHMGSELDSVASLRWTATVEQVSAPASAKLSAADRFQHVANDPVCLLHSSGTTGSLPKPAIHTHGSIVAGPKFRLVDHDEKPGGLTMTGLPQSHLACIAYTTYATLGGTPLVALYDPSGEQILEAVREYRPNAVMAFGHTYPELASLDIPAGALNSVDVWVSIADAIHEVHMKKILSQRDPALNPSMFFDRFGTTELGWGHLLKIRTLATERSDRCIGTPVGVGEVVVLRQDGTKAEDNEIGLLGAKGPAITAGYYNDHHTTYQSGLNGYWLTGDLVYRNDDGVYFHMDRAVDAIETSGGMGYSVLMEEILLSNLPEIRDCTIVAGKHDGRTVPVAVVSGCDDADPAQLLKRANEALHIAAQPELAVLEIADSDSEYPLGVTGKSLKRQLRDKYGALETYLRRSDSRLLASAIGETGL